MASPDLAAAAEAILAAPGGQPDPGAVDALVAAARAAGGSAAEAMVRFFFFFFCCCVCLLYNPRASHPFTLDEAYVKKVMGWCVGRTHA